MPRSARTWGRDSETTTVRAGLGDNKGLVAFLRVHIPVAGVVRGWQLEQGLVTTKDSWHGSECTYLGQGS